MKYTRFRPRFNQRLHKYCIVGAWGSIFGDDPDALSSMEIRLYDRAFIRIPLHFAKIPPRTFSSTMLELHDCNCCCITRTAQ